MDVEEVMDAGLLGFWDGMSPVLLQVGWRLWCFYSI